MKTLHIKKWLVLGLPVLMASAASPALADGNSQAAAPAEKSYTGIVVSIDPKEHVLDMKNWTTLHKKFNLGESCLYSQLEKNSAALGDLRPGEKVTVCYQDAHGVLIAGRVEQQPMRIEGMVKKIDTDKHTLVLHGTMLDKEMQFPDDCKIVLRYGQSGNLNDLKVGNHVTITYETPDDQPTARQIAQTSIPFTGTLTAVDLNDKTVKAKSLLSTKKFNIADNCVIVVNGKPDGQLSDLKLNEKLMLSYDEINGVNVVNRIGPAETSADTVAVSPSRTVSSDY